MAASTTARQVKLAAALVVCVLVLIVLFQNTEPVSADILFWTLSMPRFIMVFVAFALGAAVGALGLRILRKLF